MLFATFWWLFLDFTFLEFICQILIFLLANDITENRWFCFMKIVFLKSETGCNVGISDDVHCLSGFYSHLE